MSESLPDAALHAHPTQVAVIDTDGTIVYTNESWASFGEANDMTEDPSTIGCDYLAVCGASDDPYAQSAKAGIEAILDGDRDTFAFEYPCHSPEAERWFTMRARPFDHDGKRYVLLMHLDITQRRLAEQRVEQKNERLERLAGILSHDLRNPLNVAMGRLDMLDESSGDVDAIKGALDRMSDIIGDARILARGDVDERVPVELEQAATDAWESIAPTDATLEITGAATIAADATLLAHCLENLFRNAVQHGGDAVHVTVEPLEDGFAVSDDGPGIPADEGDAIFETGFTTASDGTGLGLAIVELVATAHGWSVSVGDAPGGGARFEIRDVATDGSAPAADSAGGTPGSRELDCPG